MMKKQVPTRNATTVEIMTSREFERGLDDVRKGIAFDWRNGDWDYERGRLFGHIAPVSMQLRIGSKLNPNAVALCDAAFDRGLII
jgi:hypothetical protein